MKTLLLIRHGKSDLNSHHKKDKDRPLTKKGHKNAVQIGELVCQKGLVPQMILSSSAARTRGTIEAFLSGCAPEAVDVRYLDSFYMAEANVYLEILGLLSDHFERVMIAGHNPGLEALLQNLTGKIISLPTSSVAHLHLPIDNWKQLSSDTQGQLLDLWKPKEIKNLE